jgi:2-phospho-L-lactate guanylyltransferase
MASVPDGGILSEASGQAERTVCGKAGGLWALIPVKNLAIAKQRLRDRLGDHREEFAKAMLADVLAAVADSRAIAGTVVVTADPAVIAVATQSGLTVVKEHGSEGLNAAIDQGVEAIRRMGIARVVILPSDIPLLTGAELDRLIGEFEREAEKRDDNAIGISPSAEGSGTNFLVLSIRRAFAFQYGPDSYMIHSEHARLDRRGVIAMHSPTVSLDIDEPRQIGELLDFCARHPEFQKTQTWKFLHDTMRANGETMKTRGI